MEKTSDSPALDAEILLAYCLNKNRSYLFTWPENKIDEKQLQCFNALIKKRLTDYPVAYLVGTKAFWTLDLIVTEDVLIPRPETELLVEIALEKIQNIDNPKIIDLGTGSGAIALALASERPDTKIIASDFSVKALNVAKLNADKYKLKHQITFIESNWFSNITEDDFDLIVSNPPYISPDDSHLKQTIRHEPQQALVAKNEGIQDIEILVKTGKQYLKKEAWMLLEHGYDQGNKTLDIFAQYGLKKGETYCDLNINPRISIAQR